MNEKFSEYLKDLSPELQEKAKDIKTREELNEFLSENDIELPEDALDAVSGGDGCDSGKCAHEYADPQETFEGHSVENHRWGYFRRAYCSSCNSTVYQFRPGDGEYNFYDISRETYDKSKESKLAAEGKAKVDRFVFGMKMKGRRF